MAEQHQNAMKRIIAGILITICFVSTGWYAYNIHQDYLQKKTEWDEEARETFREAVDMEVKKISQIPVQIIAVNVPGQASMENGVTLFHFTNFKTVISQTGIKG